MQKLLKEGEQRYNIRLVDEVNLLSSRIWKYKHLSCGIWVDSTSSHKESFHFEISFYAKPHKHLLNTFDFNEASDSHQFSVLKGRQETEEIIKRSNLNF